MWNKIKTSPKVATDSTNDDRLPPDDAPGQRCVSKLLGITKKELWDVLLVVKVQIGEEKWPAAQS